MRGKRALEHRPPLGGRVCQPLGQKQLPLDARTCLADGQRMGPSSQTSFDGRPNPMGTEDHTGRVAVITGASSGIGEATARPLAARGHRLGLLARRGDRIQALATELGNGAIAITADVTDRDPLVVAAERVQSELGGADVLDISYQSDIILIW